jgi:ketosteroid isomerase-like protein
VDFDTVRAMYEAWNEGNVDRMIDFWVEDGDWRWEDSPDVPGAAVVVGREAVEAHLREIISLVGAVQLTVEDLAEVDGHVVAQVTGHIRGAQSGIELEDSGVHLVEFDAGRVRSFRLFRSRDEAIAAAKHPG